MDSNDTTVAVDATDSEPVNRFELIATYLGSTPEKVSALLTLVAAHSVYPLDDIVEMVTVAIES